MKESNNKCIRIVTYTILTMFIAMIIWIVYLVTIKRQEIENNPYNKRIDNMEKYVIRGDILSRTGQVLATTEIDDTGKEYRVYPYGETFAHVVGYNVYSKAGLESMMNYYLLNCGDNELEQLVCDVVGNKKPGYNVETTLDVKLQQVAYDAIKSVQGAVVVLDSDTGDVLAMVSNPAFDPNTIENDWDTIIFDQKNTSLINRVTSGVYPPGSTFKTVTLLEYIKENVNYKSYQYQCNGNIDVEGSDLWCIYHTKHGKVTLQKAFALSCNCAFADVGLVLDRERFSETCKRLMFGEKLFATFECSKSSFVLSTKSSTFDVMQTAMGQGETLITPMHNAMIAAAIANDGVLVKPHLVNRVVDSQGKLVKDLTVKDSKELMTSKESGIIKEFMREVVKTGTATNLQSDKYVAYGKTGSAQYDNENLDAYHSWFAGFAEYDDKTIAICVIIESAEGGNVTGKSVAKKIFEAWE